MVAQVMVRWANLTMVQNLEQNCTKPHSNAEASVQAEPPHHFTSLNQTKSIHTQNETKPHQSKALNPFPNYFLYNGLGDWERTIRNVS